jgi:hypothetical protein
MASYLVCVRGFIFAGLVAMLLPLAAEAITQPTWPDAPATCLPSRVSKDKVPVAGCFCPPESMCPSLSGVKNFRDFLANSQMPPALVMQCCPLPVCPAGTYNAGKILPANGLCDCTCPDGTAHAGANVAELAKKGQSCDNPVAPSVTSCVTSHTEKQKDKDGKDVNVTVCDASELVCAANTDHAGKNVASCNDVVDYSSCPLPCPVGFESGKYHDSYWIREWPLGSGAVLGRVDYEGCVPVCNNVPLYAIEDNGGWLNSAWNGEGNTSISVTATNGTPVALACKTEQSVNDCIRSDSRVTLANGKTIAIAAIKRGDALKGPDGDAQVLAVNHLDAAANFYRINNFRFAITGDHPIQTTNGWKAVDDTRKYHEVVVGRLEVGDVLVTSNGEVPVTSITLEKPKKGTNSVNIQTSGDRAFFVDGVVIKPFKDVSFAY